MGNALSHVDKWMDHHWLLEIHLLEWATQEDGGLGSQQRYVLVVSWLQNQNPQASLCDNWEGTSQVPFSQDGGRVSR